MSELRDSQLQAARNERFDVLVVGAGINGAVLQMFNHGTITAMMFLSVGVIYDRAHHREINGFGGLGMQMPIYFSFFSFALFAALGVVAFFEHWLIRRTGARLLLEVGHRLRSHHRHLRPFLEQSEDLAQRDRASPRTP